MANYFKTIKHGLLSGLIIFLIFALPFAIMYGILFITEKSNTTNVGSPNVPVPTKDNIIEFTLFAVNIIVTTYKLILIVIIMPIISILTIKKLFINKIDFIKTLIISAIPGTILFFTFSTLYLLFQYTVVSIWHSKYYINDNSYHSYIKDLVNNYISDLTVLIFIGILFSLIGEICYLLYRKKFIVNK